MRVLVSVASKHGATADVARAITDELAEHGLEVSLIPPEEVTTIEGFDAVVVGSAIYGGRWLKAAKEFVSTYGEALRDRPVWLFSSGPLGDPLMPEGDPPDAAPMAEATAARDHRVFAGKLDKKGLNLEEKAMVKAVRAPEGDYRAWDEIRTWASGIADVLHAGASE